jgi:hypothetical protein
MYQRMLIFQWPFAQRSKPERPDFFDFSYFISLIFLFHFFSFPLLVFFNLY